MTHDPHALSRRPFWFGVAVALAVVLALGAFGW